MSGVASSLRLPASSGPVGSPAWSAFRSAPVDSVVPSSRSLICLSSARSHHPYPGTGRHTLGRVHNGSTSRDLYVMGAGWFAVEVAGWAVESGWRVVGLVEVMDLARVGGD